MTFIEANEGDIANSYRTEGKRFAIDDTRTLPLNLEDVTARWVTAALQERFEAVQVTDLEIEDITYGTATRFRLNLKYNKAGERAGLPPSMFLKSAFHDWRAHLAEVGIYENDARYYEEIQPLVDVNSPLAYFARWDDSVGERG